jgi:hypothetical protein
MQGWQPKAVLESEHGCPAEALMDEHREHQGEQDEAQETDAA